MASPVLGVCPSVPEHPCHKDFAVKLEDRLNRKTSLLDLGVELIGFWHRIVLRTILTFFFLFEVLNASRLAFLSQWNGLAMHL